MLWIVQKYTYQREIVQIANGNEEKKKKKTTRKTKFYWFRIVWDCVHSVCLTAEDVLVLTGKYLLSLITFLTIYPFGGTALCFSVTIPFHSIYKWVLASINSWKLKIYFSSLFFFLGMIYISFSMCMCLYVHSSIFHNKILFWPDFTNDETIFPLIGSAHFAPQ